MSSWCWRWERGSWLHKTVEGKKTVHRLPADQSEKRAGVQGHAHARRGCKMTVYPRDLDLDSATLADCWMTLGVNRARVRNHRQRHHLSLGADLACRPIADLRGPLQLWKHNSLDTLWTFFNVTHTLLDRCRLTNRLIITNNFSRSIDHKQHCFLVIFDKI